MLMLMLACSSEPPPPEIPKITDEEASAAAAAVICKAAGEISMDCVVEGSVAVLGEHRLEPQVSVSGFVTLQGQTIGMGATAQQIPGELQLVSKVSLLVDGELLMKVDVNDTASDADLMKAREALLSKSMERWMVGYSLPVLDAVAQDPDSKALASVGMKVPAGESGEWQTWAAYPMLRGPHLDSSLAGRMGPAVESMLGALEPYLYDVEDKEFHSVRVIAKLGGSGAPGPCGIVPPVSLTDGATASIVPLHGTIEVDGEATGTICEMSEGVAWPMPSAGQQLEWEQFMVVRAAPVAE